MDTIIQGLSNNFYSNLERIKERNDPETIKIVAKEIEAIFLQELIKEMRKTTYLNSENSFGNDIYMSMFDMEIARVLSDRGTGFQRMFIEGLSRLKEKHDKINDNQLNSKDNIEISSLSPPSPLPLKDIEIKSSFIRGKGEAFLANLEKIKGESH